MTRNFNKRQRLALLAGALAAPALGACASKAEQRAAPALKDVYAPHFLVGAAVNARVIAEPAEAALLARHFSSTTARNSMKAYSTAAAGEGQYAFGPADAHVAFAEAHGLKMRGHTLLWHWKGANGNSAPDWFFEGGDAATIRARMERYITDVAGHFAGRITAWDVVNEPASDAAGEVHRTDSPWFNALGIDYLEWALRAARAADPTTQLFLNDYNTEEEDKLARLMTLVDALLDKGVPLDGVGHQLHIHLDTPMEGIERALAATAERGLISHVTELDVSLYTDPGSCYADGTACAPDLGEAIPAEMFAQQARVYRDLFALCARYPSVKSVTTWGLADNDTWLAGFPTRRVNRPLLFDVALEPKPAFWAVADATG